MFRRSTTNLSVPIVPSFGAVSLTGPGWMVRHKDAWDEKHHVFFGQSIRFYQNTASAGPPTQNPKTGHFRKVHLTDSWVCETGGGELFGRAQIQISKGDFLQGVMLIELANFPEFLDAKIPILELITSQFIGLSLDTLKIIPTCKMTQKYMSSLTPDSKQRILSFANDFLNSPVEPILYQFDREHWMTSDFGKTYVEKLSWLSKRVERAQSLDSRKKSEAKRPWLFSLLARGRRREEKMIHPLHKIRTRCY